jgi:hypothetical protein
MRQFTKVTPEQAKAVWDSFEHPTTRKVAKFFNDAGDPVGYQTIARWHKSGWRPVDRTHGRSIVMATTVLDKTLPVVTGTVGAKMAEMTVTVDGHEMTFADVMALLGNAGPNEAKERVRTEFNKFMAACLIKGQAMAAGMVDKRRVETGLFLESLMKCFVAINGTIQADAKVAPKEVNSALLSSRDAMRNELAKRQ